MVSWYSQRAVSGQRVGGGERDCLAWSGNERGSDLLRPDEVEEAGSSLQLRAGQPAVTGVGSQQPRHLDREENGRATSLKEKLVQDFRQFVHVNVHGNKLR
jgi:hypothetical protein